MRLERRALPGAFELFVSGVGFCLSNIPWPSPGGLEEGAMGGCGAGNLVLLVNKVCEVDVVRG